MCRDVHQKHSLASLNTIPAVTKSLNVEHLASTCCKFDVDSSYFFNVTNNDFGGLRNYAQVKAPRTAWALRPSCFREGQQHFAITDSKRMNSVRFSCACTNTGMKSFEPTESPATLCEGSASMENRSSEQTSFRCASFAIRRNDEPHVECDTLRLLTVEASRKSRPHDGSHQAFDGRRAYLIWGNVISICTSALPPKRQVVVSF